MKHKNSLDRWFARNGPFFERPRFTEKEFAPYVAAIGQLLLAWNDLHERLATLLGTALGANWIPFTIWHSIRNDYAKRQVLRSIIEELNEVHKRGRSKLSDEIIWVLERCDELEGKRDDAAHTPLYNFPEFAGILMDQNILTVGSLFDVVRIGVQPNISFSNPRAMRLSRRNKDLLIEHKYARRRIVALRDYIIAIDHAWMNASVPWPDRPDLPERKPGRRSKVGASRRKKK